MSPRSRGTQAPRLGIQRALIAPGIAPQTPTAPSDMALKLQQLFGAAAGTAGAAAQFAGIQAQISGERKRARDVEKTRAFAAAAEGTVAIPEFETKAVSDAFWQNQAHKTLATLDLTTLPRLQGEDYAAAMHRWMGEHTDPTAPPVYHAVLMEGGRKQVAAQVITDARQAQATGLNDVKSATRRTFSSDSMADARNMFAGAWTSLVVANKLTDDEKYNVVLEAANEVIAMGWKKRAEQIEQFLIDEERPSLAVGIVEKATNVFQTNQFNEAMPDYEEQVEDGRPLETVLTEIKMREKAGDFSHKHRTELENYLGHVARTGFDRKFWDDYWNNASTPESRKTDILKARQQGVLSGDQANRRLGQIKEADAYTGLKNDLLTILQSGKPHAPVGPEYEQARLGLAQELGLIEANPLNNNRTRWAFVRVVPERRAAWAQFQRDFGSVTPPAIQQIARNAASISTADVGVAIQDYLALAPELREGVIEKMGALERMRLRAAEDIALSGENPLARLPEIAGYELLPLKNEQVISGVFEGDITKIVKKPLTEALKEIKKRVPEELIKPAKKWVNNVDEPPGYLANIFIEAASREYMAQAPRVGPTNAQILSLDAGARAAGRAEQPMLWGANLDHLIWVRGAPPISLQASEEVKEALGRAGIKGDQRENVMDNYRVSWNKQRQKLFLEKTVSPFNIYRYTRDGRPVDFETRAGLDITLSPPPTGVVPQPRPTREPDELPPVDDLLNEWGL